ncbi:MAG: DUF6034 family protein [Christensenella sp.]|nr:DUF6034 family protein [Christensenella sp.]
MKLWQKISLICSAVLVGIVAVCCMLLLLNAKSSILSFAYTQAEDKQRNLASSFSEMASYYADDNSGTETENAFVLYCFSRFADATAVLTKDQAELYSQVRINPGDYLVPAETREQKRYTGTIDGRNLLIVGSQVTIRQNDYSVYVAAERKTCLWDVTSTVPTDTLKGAYEFILTPTINGVPFTYANWEANNQDNQSNQYDKPWFYEKVRVIVDNDGLNSFVWDAPYQSIEPITDKASLLPYSQIQSIFARMMPIAFHHYNSADLETTCNVNIKRITLGYMRIKEQNAEGSGLIIPVWDFFGSYDRSDDPEGTTPQGSDGYESLLTINAVDGSIIDRTAGY